MPVVYPVDIEDVRLGTQEFGQMVGALMVGTNEIYVRFEKYFYDKPGNFALTLPDWVSSYGVILSGAGGGGRAGNGAVNQIGHGGRGGQIAAMIGRLSTTSDRVLRGFIGAGGAGGASSHANGQNGGNTAFTGHTGTTYTAEGGTAYPSSGKQDGIASSTTIADAYVSYYNSYPGAVYHNGPAGTGNGSDGKYGGGGAGGGGGLFGSFTQGGKGGDGFVEIYVWGQHRD